MSADPKQEFFVDGITEDLITDLAGISGLFVIARNSSFTYKGKQMKDREVARELGVRYLLQGSVRKNNGSVRITAQLANAQTGENVWSRRYDHELKDIFAIQDEVSRNVAALLAVKLKPAEEQRRLAKYTPNLEVWELYKKAVRLQGRPTPENLMAARGMFEQVVKKDPKFGGGYAGLSLGLSLKALFRKSSPQELVKGEELAKKGVELSGDLPFSHLALANAFLAQGQQDKAVEAAQEGVRVNPNDADINATLGIYLTWAGRGKEGIPQIEKAIRLDPKWLKGPYRFFWVWPLSPRRIMRRRRWNS